MFQASSWSTLIARRHSTLQMGGFWKAWLLVLLLAILRVIRVWNQTGQKHAGEPDIAKTLLPAHNSVLWFLVLATYLDVVQRLSRRALLWTSRRVSFAASLALGLTALSFKVDFTKADAPELLDGLHLFFFLRPMKEASLIAQARAVFVSITALLLLSSFPKIYKRASQAGKVEDIAQPPVDAGMLTDEVSTLRPLHDLFTLFLMTQSRATNIPLFLLFEMQSNILDLVELSGVETTLTSHLFQYASFFAFGGSNAISSIDLSNAYNGVAGYNVVAVGILTFCGNWAGPLWWTSATALLLSKRRNQGRRRRWFEHLSVLTAFVSSGVLFVMLACTALRTHLFIWTVFSPKYLYSMAWSMGQHLCINIGLGSLLYWIGTS